MRYDNNNVETDDILIQIETLNELKLAVEDG